MKKKSIFIFKNDEIGDFCLWLPFAARLKELYSDHQIVLGVKKELQSFASDFNYFDKIKIINIFPKAGLLGLLLLFLFNIKLFFKKYDLILNVVPGPKFTENMIIAFFMRAKQKKIFYTHDFLKNIPHKYVARFLLMKNNIYSLPESSIYAFNNAILNLITNHINKVHLKESFLHIAKQKDELFVLFTIGSSSKQKNWPIEKFSFIANLMSLKYPDIKIILAGTETDWQSAEELLNKNKNQIINLCGKTSLEEIISYQKNALFTLTNDTGLAHTSALLGKKTFILAGCGHFGWFVPYPPEYTHVKTFYTDCEYKNCNWICHYQNEKNTYPCLQNISPESVWEEIKQYLKSVVEQK